MENVIDSPESSVPKYRQKPKDNISTQFKVKDQQDPKKNVQGEFINEWAYLELKLRIKFWNDIMNLKKYRNNDKNLVLILMLFSFLLSKSKLKTITAINLKQLVEIRFD